MKLADTPGIHLHGVRINSNAGQVGKNGPQAVFRDAAATPVVVGATSRMGSGISVTFRSAELGTLRYDSSRYLELQASISTMGRC